MEQFSQVTIKKLHYYISFLWDMIKNLFLRLFGKRPRSTFFNVHVEPYAGSLFHKNMLNTYQHICKNFKY